MVVFFRRKFQETWQKIFLLYNYYLCFGTWVAGVLAVLLHCRPLHKIWQAYPGPGSECDLTLLESALFN